MASMNGKERSALFLAVGEAFDVCLSDISVREFDRSSNEGTVMWSQLATPNDVNLLDHGTILSIPFTCGEIEMINTRSSLLNDLEQSFSSCQDDLFVNTEQQSPIRCYQWFLSQGDKIISKTELSSVEKRSKREIVADEFIIPVVVTPLQSLLTSSDIISPTEVVSTGLTASPNSALTSATGLVSSNGTSGKSK